MIDLLRSVDLLSLSLVCDLELFQRNIIMQSENLNFLSLATRKRQRQQKQQKQFEGECVMKFMSYEFNIFNFAKRLAGPQCNATPKTANDDRINHPRGSPTKAVMRMLIKLFFSGL